MAEKGVNYLSDVSGSMESNDCLPLLKSGLKELLVKLHPDKPISLINYTDDVQKLLDDLFFLYLSENN